MSNVPGPHAKPSKTAHVQSFWLLVMCVTGVDYFSTLGYQPAIAYQNAGMLAPLATLVLILITLFGALPMYSYVAGKSFTGQGSIGLLSRLVTGWPGKIMVLVLLGFAATGFVITKTLSAADAAVHLIESPSWPLEVPEGSSTQNIVVTMMLLLLLGATFMRGFREVIGIATMIVVVYLGLNLVIIGYGLHYLYEHPWLWSTWVDRLASGQWYLPDNPIGVAGSWWSMIAVSMLLFPKLALGLSGFETGVAVMPLVRGDKDDNPENPEGRIRNTKKLLITAALIMSVMLMGSSIVVTTLINPEEITPVSAFGEPPKNWEGKPIKDPEDWPSMPASGRALAFLAHGEGEHGPKIAPFFGDSFGMVYDISTIVILWFAGASAMVGLLNLVPQYLPQYGMAPEWARATRPLVFLFTVINLLVTWFFDASVNAQGGAYATGVLVLMASACAGALIDVYRRRKGAWYRRISWPFMLITIVFTYTTIINEVEKNFRGLAIASIFIGTILLTSLISRIRRSREMRFVGFRMANAQSGLMWDAIRHLELTMLVPHRPGHRGIAAKEASVRREHRIPRDLMIVFIQVELADASEFIGDPVIEVFEEQGRYIIKVTGAASIAHTLAAVAMEMAKVGRPPEIHFGWTDKTPLSGTLGFLLFGEGNVPWMVRELIRRAEKNEDRRPQIIIAGK